MKDAVELIVYARMIMAQADGRHQEALRLSREYGLVEVVVAQCQRNVWKIGRRPMILPCSTLCTPMS